MKILSFRIENFRSIRDSGWQDFSPDGVTVLVGQNESGKSSVLEALCLACRSGGELRPQDVRSESPPPSVTLRGQSSPEEIADLLGDADESFADLAQAEFKRASYIFELATTFSVDKAGGYEEISDLSFPSLLPLLSDDAIAAQSPEDRERWHALEQEYESFVDQLLETAPCYSLFQEQLASLPDSINLSGAPMFIGLEGAAGARNFVRVSQLDLGKLITSDDRTRATLVRKANQKINSELDKYWSQFVGRQKKIELECEFNRWPQDGSSRAGHPYLSFWVSEGLERFYPSQRSRGTRWFISVFLHLLATEREDRNYVVLLDEPGSYLHATAQADVCRLIEKIAEKCPVVYSTHSPELVDFEKSYRILAVERAGDDDLADTLVQRALKLVTASTETLSPLLSKMGADLRHQTVIRRTGNVILEESSAHFYLRAMAAVLGRERAELAFVAANGVNNVPAMVAMFTAWNLRYAVLVDDDKQAREVRKQLATNFFGDHTDEAEKRVLRLRDKSGIEDAFSDIEFFDVLLEGSFARSEGVSNSEFAKRNKIKKPVVAYKLYVRAEKGEVTRSNFSNETLTYFDKLFDALVSASK